MKFSRIVLILGLFLLLVIPATEAFGQKLKAEYTLQLNVGPAYDWGMGAQKWADLIKEKTNGRVNVKPYFMSALLAGKQTNWYQAVADGSIDFVLESTINASSVIKPLNLFNLPFFLGSYENADKVENGKAGQIMIKEFERGGVKFLAWGENGFRQLTNSKRPIASPKDVAGLKLRVVGSPIFIDIFKQLGADPVTMNWGDAVTAFQQGVVDGQENPKGVLTVVRIWEYHKYMTNWCYVLDPLIFGVNAKVWKSFPADIQKAILEATKEAAAFEKSLARAYLDGTKSIDALKAMGAAVPDSPFAAAVAKGFTVTDLSKEQMQAFQDATKPVYDKWIPVIGKSVYEAAIEDMKN